MRLVDWGAAFACSMYLDVFLTMWAFICIVALIASIMVCVEWIQLAITLARVLLLGVQCSAASHCFTHMVVFFGLKLGGDGINGEFCRLNID
jgi:hypothetical protein